MNIQTNTAGARARASVTHEAIRVREARSDDIAACGAIIHAAFCGIAAAHSFPSEFPTLESAKQLATAFIADAAIYGVVAEEGSRVIGVNFLHEGDRVRAVGPIAVDPGQQGRGVGRLLMQAILERAGPERQVRLVQSAFNTISLSLYASNGFAVKEPLFLMAGQPRGPAPSEGTVRRLRQTDIPACAALCKAVHGVTRTHELASPNPMRDPMVIERNGRITGYLTAPAVWLLNHGVAETPADMRALIVGAAAITRRPASLLLPVRGNPMFEWALTQGLKVVMPLTLMARGAYAHPRQSWFPSVLY